MYDKLGNFVSIGDYVRIPSTGAIIRLSTHEFGNRWNGEYIVDRNHYGVWVDLSEKVSAEEAMFALLKGQNGLR